MAIQAVLFDAYGTLFDVHSVSRLANELYPGQGSRLCEIWRERQLEYSRLRSLSGRYEPFSRITADALGFALKRLELSSEGEARARLLAAYSRLDLFSENRAALTALAELGLPLAVLSNGDPEMLERVIGNAGLADRFAHVLSAHSVRSFKTAPAVYQLGVDAFGVPAKDLLFVSSNGWDACGAAWFGFTSFWINRSGQPPEELGVTPDGVGRDMSEVVQFVRIINSL